MRALGLTLVALVLAGCAEDPPPLVVPEPTFSDAEVPAGFGLAPLEWRTLSHSAFTLAPTQAFAADLVIPNGTIAVYVNMTLEAGAAYGLSVQIGTCQWSRDLAFVAAGQEVVADCGGILDGPDRVQLGTTAGALAGDVQVVGLLCAPSAGRCPGRLPVP